MKQQGKYLNLGKSLVGRTFVCGDIHGCYSDLMFLLERVKFNFSKDRLICCGDLIDRGPESYLSALLVDEVWFHTVLGNHEELMLDATVGRDENHVSMLWYQNGGTWAYEETFKTRCEIASKLARLPLAIEVEVDGKNIAIIHADPILFDWNDTKAALIQMEEYYNPEPVEDPTLEMMYEKAIWSRSHGKDYLTIKNIDLMIHGHTIKPSPVYHENRLFLDTGSFLKSSDYCSGGISIICLNTMEISSNIS